MEYWIWLKQVSGIGTILGKRLLSHFLSPQAVYEASEDELLSVKGIGPGLAKVILRHRSLDKAQALYDEALTRNIKFLHYYDPLYPSFAKEAPEAPILLFYKGAIRKDSAGVAIVGSRRCTDYGKRAAAEAARFLAQNSITVIAGMAKGIDSYAHTACLKSGGYTIAFLGNGIDICYPKEHDQLFAGIIENGAVISEYPLGTRPRPEYFPKRNGLISSWSSKVLVVEAGEGGGALITADFARKLGREVYVLPHEIGNPTGKGCNQLIARGAKVYLNPAQLLTDLDSDHADMGFADRLSFGDEKVSAISKTDIAAAGPCKPARNLTEDEKKLLSCLSSTPKTVEKISHETEIDQLDLVQLLSLLELEGFIRSYPGGRFGQA